MALTYPDDLKYLDSHEYVRLTDDVATIGISAFAIDQLGDIVFLELADVGEQVNRGKAFGSVESVKVAEDLYSPVSGTVLARNTAILEAIERSEAPELLVNDPYGEGWLLKVRVADPADIEQAMSADAYRAKVEGSH